MTCDDQSEAPLDGIYRVSYVDWRRDLGHGRIEGTFHLVPVTIDYEAAAIAHAKNLGDRLQHDGTPFPDIMDEVRIVVDAALGGKT